ncbi:MAG: NYN domain-containing protein [Verrucomicrobiota bacterium]|jgi:uncharacterized LabA/DUF88 family protein
MAHRPRAYVYVDGFNLFFRALRGTSFKWLNVYALCEEILPQYDIIKVNYYTAKIRSRGDPQKSLRHETYIRALRTLSKVEIIYGTYSMQKVKRELVAVSLLTRLKRIFGIEVGMNRCVKVYDPKEKGSDVNLAVHMVNDAWQDCYDVGILISNDTDLLEAVKAVRQTCKKKIGIINPHKDPNPELHKEADFVRQIRTNHLAAAQFPDRIPNTKISKPVNW